jgi:hypothetical protein
MNPESSGLGCVGFFYCLQASFFNRETGRELQNAMDFVETNFTRWANYWVGVAVLAALFAATLISFRFIFG